MKNSDPTRDLNEQTLPCAAATWSVKVKGADLNYGQVHEIIHRDIAVGNDYRKERIKLLTALATGVFALTVTFHKDLFGMALTRTALWLMLLGWATLLISLLAGIVHFRKWEDFYLEHRKQGNALWEFHIAAGNADEQKKAIGDFYSARNKINELQKSYIKWNWIQSGGLIVGLAFMAIYVAVTGFAVSSKKPQTSPPARAGEIAPVPAK